MAFMRKTAAFLGVGALQNLVSDSMAIDMGSASTIIAVRGRGVVVDEPSLVAVDTATGEVIAIGREARVELVSAPANNLPGFVGFSFFIQAQFPDIQTRSALVEEQPMAPGADRSCRRSLPLECST